MNINDMEEFVTGMTSSDLDLLAKMAKEELENRVKKKKEELWEKACEALYAYQQYDSISISVQEGPNYYQLKLDKEGFHPDIPGVLMTE